MPCDVTKKVHLFVHKSKKTVHMGPRTRPFTPLPNHVATMGPNTSVPVPSPIKYRFVLGKISAVTISAKPPVWITES